MEYRVTTDWTDYLDIPERMELMDCLAFPARTALLDSLEREEMTASLEPEDSPATRVHSLILVCPETMDCPVSTDPSDLLEERENPESVESPEWMDRASPDSLDSLACLETWDWMDSMELPDSLATLVSLECPADPVREDCPECQARRDEMASLVSPVCWEREDTMAFPVYLEDPDSMVRKVRSERRATLESLDPMVSLDCPALLVPTVSRERQAHPDTPEPPERLVCPDPMVILEWTVCPVARERSDTLDDPVCLDSRENEAWMDSRVLTVVTESPDTPESPEWPDYLVHPVLMSMGHLDPMESPDSRADKESQDWRETVETTEWMDCPACPDYLESTASPECPAILESAVSLESTEREDTTDSPEPLDPMDCLVHRDRMEHPETMDTLEHLVQMEPRDIPERGECPVSRVVRVFVETMDYLVLPECPAIREKEEWTDCPDPMEDPEHPEEKVRPVLLDSQLLHKRSIHRANPEYPDIPERRDTLDCLETTEELDREATRVCPALPALLDSLDFPAYPEPRESMVLPDPSDWLEELVRLVSLALLASLVLPEHGRPAEDSHSPNTHRQPIFLNVPMVPLLSGLDILFSTFKETERAPDRISASPALVFPSSTRCPSCSVTSTVSVMSHLAPTTRSG